MAPPDNIPPLVPYSTVEVDVSFTGNPGPVGAEVVPPYAIHPPLSGPPLFTNQDAFVVELHTTDYANVSPPDTDTRIGYKAFATGSYTDVKIPIFPDWRFNRPFNPSLQPGEQFPPNPNGDANIEGYIFSDLGLDYSNARNLLGGTPVPATITDPDPDLGQNPSVPDNEPLRANSSGELEDSDGNVPDRGSLGINQLS